MLMSYNMGQQRRLSGNIALQLGEYYNGTIRSVTGRGVDIAGGTVTNAAGAVISGNVAGVRIGDISAVDAVVIATPVSSHFELTMAALSAGKHVLVEKPIASNSEQACQLLEEAAKRQLVLMVDHTFVYTDAVRKMRELISSGALG